MKNKILPFILSLIIPLLYHWGYNIDDNITPLPNAEKVKVNVIVLIEDPIIEGKRFHEHFGWSNPFELTKIYKDSMEAYSHGVVEYEIKEIIDADTLFTFWKNEPGKFLSVKKVFSLLSEKGWLTLKTRNNNGIGTKYDYAASTKYYSFDQKRENNEVYEVWIWSWPYGGMYESRFVSKDKGFWLNSPPLIDSTLKNSKLLTIMGFNYERTADLAIHSFGHRFESIMRKVYGRWDNTKAGDERNNWEKFVTIDKDYPDEGQVGNCHFPVNGVKDYDYANPDTVISYRNAWKYYPSLKFDNPDSVSCANWNCTQFGYMAWWLKVVPHFEGIGTDKKLNNWWYYVVRYEDACEYELKLQSVDKEK